MIHCDCTLKSSTSSLPPYRVSCPFKMSLRAVLIPAAVIAANLIVTVVFV